MVDSFYVTLGPDILRNCGLSILKRVKLKDPICFGNPIRFYLVRNDVAELNDKFYHFQYATLEMFKRTFIKFSKLKLRFFFQHPHYCNAFEKRLSSVLYNESGPQTTYFITELPKRRDRSMPISYCFF